MVFGFPLIISRFPEIGDFVWHLRFLFVVVLVPCRLVASTNNCPPLHSAEKKTGELANDPSVSVHSLGMVATRFSCANSQIGHSNKL